MPWANSSPASPHSRAKDASRARDTPLPAWMVRCPGHSPSGSSSRRLRPLKAFTTSRSAPPSDTSRLVPLPMKKGFTPNSTAATDSTC